MTPLEVCQKLYEKDVLPLLSRDPNGNHWNLAIKYIIFRCDCVLYETRRKSAFFKFYNRVLGDQYLELKKIIRETKADEV